MKYILIIIWLLLGLIATWRAYHGSLKEWYKNFNESYWDFHKRTGTAAIMTLLILSPIYIIGGGLSLLMFELMITTTWYFNTPKDK